jgi:hypothetical protein
MAAVLEEHLILDADAYEGREKAETIRAILAAPAPCDGCGNRWFCSTNAACRVFSRWVKTGKLEDGDRTPDRKIWHRLFRASDE